jgi:hypothetical protein
VFSVQYSARNSLLFTVSKFPERIGETEHEVPGKNICDTVFDKGIGNLATDTFVLIQQVERLDSGFERFVLQELITDRSIPEPDALVKI